MRVVGVLVQCSVYSYHGTGDKAFSDVAKDIEARSDVMLQKYKELMFEDMMVNVVVLNCADFAHHGTAQV